jgi:hypothetical protein
MFYIDPHNDEDPYNDGSDEGTREERDAALETLWGNAARRVREKFEEDNYDGPPDSYWSHENTSDFSYNIEAIKDAGR